jgi:hypothetical protein
MFIVLIVYEDRKILKIDKRVIIIRLIIIIISQAVRKFYI